MSAYSVTNLPNPVIDLKTIKEKQDENDWYYEESEAVSKENDLITSKDYYLYTFWQDCQLGRPYWHIFSLSFQKTFKTLLTKSSMGI